jgi:hypothetical protein
LGLVDLMPHVYLVATINGQDIRYLHGTRETTVVALLLCKQLNSMADFFEYRVVEDDD